MTSLRSVGRPRALACAVALTVLSLAPGCAGGDHRNDKRLVDTVVRRFLAAERAGDGRTWCGLLDVKRHAFEEQAARELGPHVTCSQAQSPHPPGASRRDRRYIALARHQDTTGLRIEQTKVSGDRAEVRFSWLVPRRLVPIASTAGSTRRGNRFITNIYLRREQGSWKIGYEHE